MENRIILSGIILAFFHTLLIGQVDLKMLSSKNMKKDLKEVLETIDAHPDPYTKINEDDFNVIVKDVELKISTEMDELEFYKNLSRIIASIGDGHSRLALRKFFMKKIRKDNGAFPYEVFLTNENDLFIIKSYSSTEEIDLGAQVLEINGISIDLFIETVSQYISYETIPFRNDRISELFELMLYLVFKQVNDLNFTVKYGKTYEKKITTIPYKVWRKQVKDTEEEREKKVAIGEPYDFNILQPGIAKIDIFSFAVSDIDKYSFFLNKTFKTIKKNEIHSIIIDVRGNYGGWPKVASELFHYIHEGYFKTMAKSSMKISYPYRRSFTDQNPNIRTANVRFEQKRHYVDLEQVIHGKIDTYVDEESFFNEEPITKINEFQGDCYVLIDRKSYSASSAFASTFQCYTMGYLIGEPTGGTKIFRANAMGKRLSKTGFIVMMSTTKLYTACYNEENEPVQPNIVVVPTITDRIFDVDPQLNTALLLIKKMQKAKAELAK